MIFLEGEYLVCQKATESQGLGSARACSVWSLPFTPILIRIKSHPTRKWDILLGPDQDFSWLQQPWRANSLPALTLALALALAPPLPCTCRIRSRREGVTAFIAIPWNKEGRNPTHAHPSANLTGPAGARPTRYTRTSAAFQSINTLQRWARFVFWTFTSFRVHFSVLDTGNWLVHLN